MLRINNVKVSLDEKDYTKKLSQVLNISSKKIKEVILVKQSVDARKKNNIYFNCSFDFMVENEELVIKQNKKFNLTIVEPYQYPKMKATKKKIVVVGSGPAGLFCAYNLVRSGQKVTLIEQGKDVDSRKKDIDLFFSQGILNTNSNIQFGEGGAGTFSDGKLTTGTKDSRKRFVLETFVKHGANKDLLYLNKPHVGTDYLIDVIRNMREYIINHGGEICFETKLIDLNIKDNKIASIIIENNNTNRVIEVDNLVLALGHSARDTYEMLFKQGLEMAQKPFAIGLRIEHEQSFINEVQYGKYALHPNLPTADYKLAVQASSNKGVYTFCMCPGGTVVNASSELNRIVVNGMSNYKRDGNNANSAVLVTIEPSEFNDNHPLAGITFQRQLEEKAFVLGGSDYSIPIQSVEDYLGDVVNENKSNVTPSVLPKTKYTNLNQLFSSQINNALKEGLIKMNEKLAGFTKNAILSGVESRSSAPLRIIRNEQYESNISGIFPIGEGAGYAGGIMSSAVDGLKCAEIILGGKV